MVIVELGDLGARNGTRTGKEDHCPQASIVNDGEDAVISSALRQSSDQVQGYLCEWRSVDRDVYLEQGNAGAISEVFVLLAGRTPLYILLYPLLCPWPVESFHYLPHHLVLARVTTQSIMVGVHYSFLQHVVWGND